MDRPVRAKTLAILQQSACGSQEATEQLTGLLYEQLRATARAHLRRERPGHTLQPTALVHEAYLRLVDQSQVDRKSRSHFLAIASKMMRRILINHARERRAQKRGGGATRVSLLDAPDEEQGSDVLALEAALVKLEEDNPRRARVVELRFFGGMSVEETAEILEISPRTVKNDWRFARAWLLKALDDSEGES